MQQTLQTTVVGSYPVPEWLKVAPSPDASKDAMRLILDVQERAGVDVVGDGELGRWDLIRREPAGMVERFVRPMSGIQTELTRRQREDFRAAPGTAYRATAPGVVVETVGHGDLDLLREYELAKSLTSKPLKFTLTSPYMLAKVVADQHYKDVAQLTMAFAEILAEQIHGIDAAVIQIDEPHLPGHPDHSHMAAQGINRVFEAVSGDTESAVHLCFGNFGGQMIQHGDYRKLIEFLNQLSCNHVILETTRRSEMEIEALNDIDNRIGLGLGVIDVKDLQIESPEEVAGRIEKLATCFGEHRIHYVHPDCGLQVLPRRIADAKLQSLVRGRDLFRGQKD